MQLKGWGDNGANWACRVAWWWARGGCGRQLCGALGPHCGLRSGAGTPGDGEGDSADPLSPERAVTEARQQIASKL